MTHRGPFQPLPFCDSVRGSSITSMCSSRATVTAILHLVLVFTLKARAERDELLESLS